MANNSTEALSELRAFQGSRRKSQDVLRESEERLGLPSASQRQAGLRAAITNTENLIRSVEPSVSGRTSGSLVTEAQKTRLVGQERAPLDDSFREQSRAFEGETANINELKRQSLTDAQLALAEDETKERTLSGLYEALYKREQDEVARQERERLFAEQQRQFNEQQRAARAASAGGNSLAKLLAGGGGGGTTTDAAQSPLKATAAQQVNAMLSRRGSESFYKEIAAIAKSAGYGNTLDQAKLELLAASQPGLFPGGKLDTRRLAGLYGGATGGS